MNDLAARLSREQRWAFDVGVIGSFACGIGLAFVPGEVFASWLFSFVFWTGLSLGCFNAAAIHYLTGGRWGNPARRMLEAGYMTLPVMAVLFVPLLFGLHELYPWARPGGISSDGILRNKAAYENPFGFSFRAICFFASWIFFATRLRRWSLQEDTTSDATPTIRMRAWSGPAIVLVPLTATFALVDWVMSLEAEWFSTIFGLILLTGQVLAAVAMVTLLLARMHSWEPFQTFFAEQPAEKHFHDLGNLLLAFVMFWTYVAFSQLLVIYSGNQPHEIGWYLHRIAGSWKWLIGLVAAFHFFIPFSLLLFRAATKSIRALACVAATILCAQVLEIFWMVAPKFYPAGISVHWTDLAAFCGVGGFWFASFAGNLRRHPLLARNDPRLGTSTVQTADAK